MADDETALFREAVKDAKPLKSTRVLLRPKPPRPIPRQSIRDEQQALKDSLSDTYYPADEIESGEELLYLREGHSPDILKKLRRGHWVTQAELDLHGMQVEEARSYTAQFLSECKRKGVRCVRIIHGKGLGSKNREPVLKNKLRGWLIQRDEIIAYCQARRVDGGGGAVLVLLKAA
ncbi:MAG: Smr/MutS family protein [Methylophilales bacterium]|nr:Smr/MutS family protein [Methylophilales bacterium]